MSQFLIQEQGYVRYSACSYDSPGGEEASFIVMVDGKHTHPLTTLHDYKVRDNGDTGPNTGGMGAYVPAPVVTPGIHAHIMNQVILPASPAFCMPG